MSYELRNTEQGRLLYNQLRLALVYPGDSIAGVTKPYTPVNYDKWSLTFDDLIASPATPRIAYLQARYPLAGVATLGMGR
jgi:hypothetical protein